MKQHLQPEKSMEKTRDDYNRIAMHFAVTRRSDKPEFDFFKPYIPPDASILDIACGTGRGFMFLEAMQIPFTYTGVDIAIAQLAEAKKQFPGIRVMEGNMTGLPFEEGTFDRAIILNALHHLPSYPARLKALQEACRILKPGGILCLSNWDLFQKQFIKHWLKNTWRSVVTLGSFGIRDFFIPWKSPTGEVLAERYYYAFTKGEMKRLARQAGFQILENHYAKGNKIARMWGAYNLVTVLKKVVSGQ